MLQAAETIYPSVQLGVHLDHGDEETCYDCIDSGFYSSVMIDASSKTLEENIAITQQVVSMAHARGVCVEAELGRIFSADTMETESDESPVVSGS